MVAENLLGVDITRIWVGTSCSLNSSIRCSEPRPHNVQTIDTGGTLIYVIPSTETKEIKDADAVYVQAHGGGLFAGHPLQYLDA